MTAMRAAIRLVAPAILLLLTTAAPAGAHPYEQKEYRALQRRLQKVWSAWDSRSVLSQTLLPEGLSLSLGFKEIYWLGDHYLGRALVRRGAEDAEVVRPGLHALDGSYTELEIHWRQLQARVETAHDGEDLVILVTPQKRAELPLYLIVEIALPWNRSGALARQGSTLSATLPKRTVRVFSAIAPVEYPYVDTSTPYLALPFSQQMGVATGRARTLAEIREIVERLVGPHQLH